MAISAISCIYFLIFVKRSGMDFVRYGSVRIIISLLTTLFVIYVSKDISKNVIIAGCTFGIVFTFSTDYNHAIDEKKHFMSEQRIWKIRLNTLKLMGKNKTGKNRRSI